ncbi:NIPSNAP family protein [Sphingosinicella ginsenosidimutans]|uniref:NIPSNAP family protein n=1 Tax=Allosphingosinicella ginsenosidimutans TaxID=1176539 RepID=A0A5C6TQL5_9SPHN|nr:NIPSNAP family protein [Sphingosinicella ginsenosidimutans]TXC62301.1 NIPSNAP family protein [Sphingosinicella ginsenosidimutans]
MKAFARSFRIAMIGLALGIGLAGAAAASIVELRQYKINHGQRDAFVALFDREFVEPQEADGMRIVGQFRDLDDPDRFVWIRSFPDMDSRARSLNAFYFGPVWQAHRDEANPMLFDNDNVLLLHPSSPTGDFPPAAARSAHRAPPTPHGLVVATIYYLWKAPDEDFSRFFDETMRPAIAAAGIPVLASLAPESAQNNFPRLPVRRGEKLFVWITRFDSEADRAAAMRRLDASPAWRRLAPGLADRIERAPQVLRLEPTPRSALR